MAEINPNDLRTGNYIYGPSGKVCTVTWREIRAIANGGLQFEFIKLTEDWLLRMGFTPEKQYWNYSGEFRLFYNQYAKVFLVYYADFVNIVGWIQISTVEFVHELQNWYKMLFSEELTIAE